MLHVLRYVAYTIGSCVQTIICQVNACKTKLNNQDLKVINIYGLQLKLNTDTHTS